MATPGSKNVCLQLVVSVCKVQHVGCLKVEVMFLLLLALPLVSRANVIDAFSGFSLSSLVGKHAAEATLV